MSRDVSITLEDIRDHCSHVIGYTAGLSYEQFIADDKTHAAVLWHLVTIGEAVRGVPQDFRNRYPDIEWARIAALRNVLIHEYFGVNDTIVWDVVQDKIPTLLGQVQNLLERGIS